MRFRVALLKGRWGSAAEAVVMAFEWMDRHIHAELWVEELAFSAVGDAPTCVVMFRREPGGADPARWDLFDVELRDAERALAIVDEMRKTPARYEVCLSEFAFPSSLVSRADGELDPMAPATWDTLYCSEFVLMFLRRCDMEGLLVGAGRALWDGCSRKCLPSTLFSTLTRMGWTPSRPGASR